MKSYQGQQYIYMFIMIILLGFTGWYYAQPSLVNNPIPKDVLIHLPDIIITDLNITQFNAQGNMANHFYTPELTHFPYNNLSQFIEPRIIVYSQASSEQPWLIQANQGESEQGSKIITLSEHVHMHQQGNGTEKEKTILTDEITYYADTDTATTQDIIYFSEPGLHVKSQGMTANLKEQRIHLLQQVTSEYQPNAVS